MVGSVEKEKALKTKGNCVVVNELFEEQVKKAPNNIALVFGDKRLTYRELNNKSNQLARVLRERGIYQDNIVAIMTKRSIEMIIGMIAVIKAGGAYLPLDPKYPEERVNYMLKDSSARILLTQSFFLNGRIAFNGDIIDLGDKKLYAGDYSNLDKIHGSGNLIYMIYTSGSTGNPKGVMIEHKAVSNLIKGITERIDFTQGKSILALSSISFDMSILEIILSLTKGLRVIIADENQQRNPKLLGKLILNSNVDILQMTPSSMQLLLMNHDKSMPCLKNLKEIMIGGEPFPPTLLEKLVNLSQATIYNMYGPTETTVWSTIKNLTESGTINIGTPIANTQIYIIDENNNLQSSGAKGELCIAGDGLAREYWGNPELTMEKFIPNPFKPDERIYKTGDIAKWLPEGNIEYLGRVDLQVKIRGYRVELPEIEYHILKYKSVKDAIVVTKVDKECNRYLCAYLVFEGELDTVELRNILLKVLPDYMVPSLYIRIDKMPLTPNGKVDRISLSEAEAISDKVEDVDPSKLVQSRDEVDLEQKLRAILYNNIILSMPPEEINLDDSIESMGVDSISYMRLVIAIETEFKFEFNDEDLGTDRISTLKGLISYVDRKLVER